MNDEPTKADVCETACRITHVVDCMRLKGYRIISVSERAVAAQRLCGTFYAAAIIWCGRDDDTGEDANFMHEWFGDGLDNDDGVRRANLEFARRDSFSWRLRDLKGGA